MSITSMADHCRAWLHNEKPSLEELVSHEKWQTRRIRHYLIRGESHDRVLASAHAESRELVRDAITQVTR